MREIKSLSKRKYIYIILGTLILIIAIYLFLRSKTTPRYISIPPSPQTTKKTISRAPETITLKRIKLYLIHLSKTNTERNPFLSEAEAKIREEIIRFLMPHLESIIIAGKNKTAFIDGHAVGTGNTVEGFKVIKIGVNYVILSKNGKKITIKLKREY